VLHNIERYGNTTAGTIPLLWDECARTGRLKPGDLVLLVAFGAGMSWGASLLRA
jgi:3-oxoacyl-[acyl-carrier-protein] synthase-3